MTQQTTSLAQVAPLGPRMRDRRKALGLTLQAVAEAAGLTAGFISQVERSLAEPSLTSLRAISQVLSLDIGSMLSPFAEDEGEVFTPRTARDRYGVGSEQVYERLTRRFAGYQLRGVLIHMPPRGVIEAMRHEGEEMFYILQGALTLNLEGRDYLLEEGDTLHFASTRMHKSSNHTEAETVILHVSTGDVFNDAARVRAQNGAGPDPLADVHSLRGSDSENRD